MISEILDLKKEYSEDGIEFDEEDDYLYAFDIDGHGEDDIYDWFDERDYHGGGYSWEGMIWGMIMLNAPKRIDDVFLDSEGDGVRVSCNDLDFLTQVSQWAIDAKKNERLRIKAIEIAEENGQME